MRINYNATAMRANNSLNVADKRVAASLQKLSSGFKVNSAKDNPSGYAIGRRMNVQIEGVSVATRNANTGISIIETADGALTEVHEMLQRMNELAVKGATGTLTTADRATLNEEMIQLKKEVTRIARDTEFNGQTLLDGSFDLKGYVTNNLTVKVGYYSDDVLPNKYTVNALTVFYDDKGKIDMERTAFSPGANFPEDTKITSVGENCVTVSDGKGFEMTFDIMDDDPNHIMEAAKASDSIDKIECTNVKESDGITEGDFSFKLEYDNTQTPPKLTVTGNDADSTDFLNGATVDRPGNGNQIQITKGTEVVTVTLTQDAVDSLDGNPTATPPVTQGPVQLDFGLSDTGETISHNGPLELDITGIGAMDMQIGANEGQTLAIRIPTISLQRLGLTGAELMTQDSSSDAIVSIKSAIAYVSSVRSRLGAYQNRLEHTVGSLDITNENMTASYSRIMDVDMSEEMTTYTSQQVVSQAAVSMLAQANERPSQLLQLLQ